ncbi:MAG TPA: iron-sulfur cluster assembly accessory protein [Polyangiaceae bacterium]|jgi:iron-sulfur cluster assembly protein|nr:iron-sulfur cluster assembly accessory protein [Polyangiaceae bacterium]
MNTSQDQTAPVVTQATPRITLTPEAAAFVKERLAKEGRPDASLRVGVRGGGCNGLTYVLDYTDEPPRPRDLVYDFHGTRVLVDNRSIDYIDGSEIVYERSLMFTGLKFKNPLEASTCGCGETFSVKAEAMATAKKRAVALPTTE